MTIPTDLRRALEAAPVAKGKWGDLTPIARRDFLTWIDGAKQAATRQRRIAQTCEMLVEGKRRPCCFTIVPLDLHKALKLAPKAKTEWSHLTPDERRDLIGWIGAAKGAVRTRRLERACAALAAGKRLP